MGKGCYCMAKGSVKAQGLFAKWDWMQHASELCGDADAKIVHWIRHAQGVHQRNLFVNSFLLVDPKLTRIGRTQARNLLDSPLLAAALYNVTQRAQLVIASPMRRTMETALLGFNESLHQARWLLDADIQEIPGVLACNRGDALKGAPMLSRFGREDLLRVYNKLDPSWTERSGGRYGDSSQPRRFREFTHRLERYPEERVVVVSHGLLMMRALGKRAPRENGGVAPFALCGGRWHFLG